MFLRNFVRACELPLLVKELNEQSARPRTYVVRFLYAATLFAAGCTLFYGNYVSGGAGETAALGRGRLMFERLVTLQLLGIYVLLPAISCGAFTIEKERNSLALLLLTALRPWQILLQKVLGRAIPMITFVLLSFPLMAVAYSFGGVTVDYLWSGTLILVLTCLQVAALSVACSAYFPTTVEAFAASYVIFLVLFGAIPVAWGRYLFVQADQVSFAVTLISCIPLLILTGGFLVAGWLCVESRAFVPPGNVVLGLFKRMDEFFNQANVVTGGVILVRDGDPLPGTNPIAWRETAKKSLGTFRYQFRVLVAVELPLLFLCAALRSASPGGATLQPVSVFLYVLWLLSTALIVVHAGSVISSERTRQTLDVLLTIPMPGRDLILDKLQGVRRLQKVLLIPFLTIFGFETWWNQGTTYRWIYLPLALASVLVYLPLIVWLALAVGLRVRSQIKTVLTALSLIGAWLAVPIVVRAVWGGMLGLPWSAPIADVVPIALAFSPLELVPAIESAGRIVMAAEGSLRYNVPPPEWGLMALNLVLHGTAMCLVRWWCLANADRLLGRLDDKSPPAPRLPQLTPAVPSAARVTT